MRRPHDKDRPLPQIGDRCWLLESGLLYVGEITQVRSVLEGDPLHFYMFKVHTMNRDFDSVHRGDLYLAPIEREYLIQECDEIAGRFQTYKEELRDQIVDDVDHIPEIGDDL